MSNKFKNKEKDLILAETRAINFNKEEYEPLDLKELKCELNKLKQVDNILDFKKRG